MDTFLIHFGPDTPQGQPFLVPPEKRPFGSQNVALVRCFEVILVQEWTLFAIKIIDTLRGYSDNMIILFHRGMPPKLNIQTSVNVSEN